jgi:hypothetical protein
MPGIEPGAFHMQSERSTTELHPLRGNKIERQNFKTTHLAYLTVATKIIDLFTIGET